jgi:hypothetical protein
MRFLETRRAAAGVVALVLGAAPVCPLEADGVSTTVSGYGTVGGSLVNNDQYAYHHDITEFKGAANQFDTALDSRLGVQAVVDFGSGLSLTAQEVFRLRGNDAFSPGTEWLFMQYSPVPKLSFRLGRFADDLFLMSDVLNVGFASSWFQAPNVVYGAGLFRWIDGGQFIGRTEIGPISFKLDAAYGKNQATIDPNRMVSVIDATNVANVALSLEYESLTLRVSRNSSSAPFELPLSPSVVIKTTVHDIFQSAGLQYDDGRALLLSEYVRRTQNDVPIIDEPEAEFTSWYVAAGWRFGSWTPLVSYGAVIAAKSLASPPGTFNYVAASVRYDIARNIAVKAQITNAAAGNFEFWDVANPHSTSRIDVFGLGVDFVF